MSRESRVTWEPLDPPQAPDARKKTINSPLISWEPLDISTSSVPQDLPLEKKERLKQFPDGFQQEAKKAWQMIHDLDRDPEAQIQKPEVQVFIRQLSASGLIGGVFSREKMRALWPDAAPATKCLPLWLQEGFLSKHGFKSKTTALNQERLAEISMGFDALTRGLPFRDLRNGRYFELSSMPRTSPEPRQYKYYIEGAFLGQALKTGALTHALQELRKLGLGLVCKLFEGDRLVIYGKGDVTQAKILTEVLSRNGVSGRGPAQDVWAITDQADSALALKVTYSNDQALGDGGKLPDALAEYPLKTYSQRAFFDWYLNVCSFTGKCPTEPYRTSFVYLLGTIPIQSRARVLQRAEVLTGYQVLIAERRIGL